MILETWSPEYQSRSFFHDDVSVEGRSMGNTIECPEKFTCIRLHGQTENVCCPIHDEGVTKGDSEVAAAENQESVDRQQSS